MPWYSTVYSEEPAALSPTSTARSTADSGIESLLVSHNTLPRSNSPSIYTTGNDDLDTVIVQHCALTEVLLEVSMSYLLTRPRH